MHLPCIGISSHCHVILVFPWAKFKPVVRNNEIDLTAEDIELGELQTGDFNMMTF